MKHARELDAKQPFDGRLHGDGHMETIAKAPTHAPLDAIVVSDSQLLFNGDFKRSGPDLILSNNDHELILRDYFKGEKRAALSSPDGAHLTGDVVNALTGHTQYAQADGRPSVSHVIGHVTKLSGTATAIRNGVSIILNNGDDVEKGDVVQSGSNSTLGITFIDGTVFGLASNARMVLNEMIYDPNGSDNKSLMSLVAGTISFVAGATAKNGDMKVDTPVATMGIRGTAVLVEIDFSVPGPGLPAAPSGKFQVLVEPNGTTGSYILFDKTTLSPVATVDQAGQQINISQGQISVTNGELSPDLQKLISDVFALKFTDNSNTKTYQHFTDSIVPQQFNGLQLTFAEFVSQTQNLNSLTQLAFNQPTVIEASFVVSVKKVDVIPVVNKASFTIQDQVVVFDSNPNDIVVPYVQGSATIRSVTGPSIIPAGVDLAKLVTVDAASGAIHYDPAQFSFLSANQSVVVTIEFDTTAGSESFHEALSVTITGTNALPVIITPATTATGAIGEEQAVTGSTGVDSVAGNIAFSDANLSDTHTASLSTPTFSWSGGALGASQLAALSSASALTLTKSDSTGTGTGSVAWHFTAPDKTFDFLASGETLTIAYVVKLDDGAGGTVTQTISVTVTGTNDLPTIGTTSGVFTELAGNSSGHAGGSITFADVDLTDHPTVSAHFTSFTYRDSSQHDVSSSLSTQQLADIAAVEASLTLTPSTTNANNGTVAWSYDVANCKFDFLGADETLTLTYSATVDDGHDGVITQPFTVTVTGTNDLPTIDATSGVLTELAGNSSGHAGGRITFADADLTDRPSVSAHFSSFTYQDSSHHDVSSSLSAQQLADIAAVEAYLTLAPSSTNANNGSVAWSYDVADCKFDFLGADETLTLIYSANVDDGHGGVITQPFSVTITGTNDAPTIGVSSDAFTELPATNNSTVDHAGGTVTFTDVNLTDQPVVSAQFTSFTYQNNSHHDVTSSLSTQQLADIAAVEASLTLTPSTTNANNGSVAWSYDVINSKFDFLGAGETLRLTYSATVDDGHGGVITHPFTVTVTGSNDAPTIAVSSGALTELPEANSKIDHTGGTITFADADLTDRPVVSTHFTSFTYQSSSHHDVTSSLSGQQLADIAAVEASLTLTPSATNTSNGSVAWSYDVCNSALDFLRAGDTLTLSYSATVDDGHGGVSSQPFTVTITGTNDAPTIVGASNPSTQAVVAVNNSGSPIILGQGITTNSFGFNTETFDSQPTGSLSNNGAGHGNFYSAALDATFSGSGHAGVVNGSLRNVSAAPFEGPLPGHADTTNYLSVGAYGTEIITFATEKNTLGFYWGSVDSENTIDFYNGTILVAHYTGHDISPLIANGNQGSFASNGYVEFIGLAAFNRVVFGSSGDSDDAFEIDNISAGSVHAQLAAPVAGSLTVHDSDIGDTLTASVTGNASIYYNGHSALPAGVSADALIAAGDITFDSTVSNGGTQILNWTYNPINANLDFLKASDTLTITYMAHVNDGSGNMDTQPLTVTIVGAGSSANMSNFQFVSGTTQNDTFHNVGNGVTIFGGGGQDTFVFNAGFKSATIADFNPGQDAIDFSHTLFSSIDAILAGAQSANSGHDTTITDSAHDKLTLTGVTIAQIQSHPNDFHLV